MKLALLFSLPVLNWTLTLLALLWDRRRLTPAQRARSWDSVATWGVAIYCAPFSALPWVWVTRQEWRVWIRRGPTYALARSAWVLLKGKAAVALLVAIYLALGTGLEVALGVDLDEPPPNEVKMEGGKRPPPARRP
jgi:hypothetical protein